jgi:hypothetical protein
MLTLLHLRLNINRASTEHLQSVNSASLEHKQSVNRASTISGIASCMLQGLCCGIYLLSIYLPPLWAKEKATWSKPQSENDRQQSVNDFRCYTLCHPVAVVRLLSIIEVLAAFIGNIVCEYIATPDNQHQLSVNPASAQRPLSVNRVSMTLGVATCVIQGMF